MSTGEALSLPNDQLRGFLASLNSSWFADHLKLNESYCLVLRRITKVMRSSDKPLLVDLNLELALMPTEGQENHSGDCINLANISDDLVDRINPSLIVLGVCATIIFLFILVISAIKFRQRLIHQRRFEGHIKPGFIFDMNQTMSGGKINQNVRKSSFKKPQNALLVSQGKLSRNSKVPIVGYIDEGAENVSSPMDFPQVIEMDKERRLLEWVQSNSRHGYLADTMIPIKAYNRCMLNRLKSSCTNHNPCTKCSCRRYNQFPVYESRLRAQRSRYYQSHQISKNWDFSKLEIPDEEEVIGEDIYNVTYQPIDFMNSSINQEDCTHRARKKFAISPHQQGNVYGCCHPERHESQSRSCSQQGCFPANSSEVSKRTDFDAKEIIRYSESNLCNSQSSSPNKRTPKLPRKSFRQGKLLWKSQSFDDITFSKASIKRTPFMNKSLNEKSHKGDLKKALRLHNRLFHVRREGKKHSLANLSFYQNQKPTEYLSKAVQDIVKKHYESQGFRKVCPIDSNESTLGFLPRKQSTNKELANKVFRSKSTCSETLWKYPSSSSSRHSHHGVLSKRKSHEKQRRFTMNPDILVKLMQIPKSNEQAQTSDDNHQGKSSSDSTKANDSPTNIRPNVLIQLTQESPSTKRLETIFFTQ